MVTKHSEVTKHWWFRLLMVRFRKTLIWRVLSDNTYPMLYIFFFYSSRRTFWAVFHHCEIILKINKSWRHQFLPDFQDLLTKMFGRPRAFKKNIYIFFSRGSKVVKKCPKSKKLCNFFLRIILSFEKKLEKVKIFKKSPKL